MNREDALKRVRGWLSETGAQVLDSPGPPPTLSFKHGSALILASAFGGDDSPVFVRLSTRVVREIAASDKPELLAFLLRRNDELVFSAFSIDDAGDVWLGAVVFADGLSKPEFSVVLTEIGTTADQADDQVVRRWGGERFSD